MEYAIYWGYLSIALAILVGLSRVAEAIREFGASK